MPKTPKLTLINEERRALRSARILLKDIAAFDSKELSKATGIKKLRCQELISLSQLQNLASVGPDMARKLWQLGFRSLDDLPKANPHQMYRDYCQLIGEHVDPCVEDVFRCAVAQTKYKDLPMHLKNWWEWTAQRGFESTKLHFQKSRHQQLVSMAYKLERQEVTKSMLEY